MESSATQDAMKKAYIETYGCQMNISDTELMHGILADGGFSAVDSPEDADVILVNTCAIRDHAEQRVLGRVGQLQQYREAQPGLVIGVTGCMAQRMGEDLLGKAGGVDLVMGPDGYRMLPAVIESARARRGGSPSRALPVIPASPGIESGSATGSLRGAGLQSGSATGSFRPAAPPEGTLRPREGLTVLDFDPHENYEGIAPRRTSSVSAWVPIQRGCNYRCTYCIVPYVRGDEKNRDPRQILAEVRDLVEAGVPEVVLLGQTVNSYRFADWDFPALLRAVARTDGVRRVRFTSPHPNDFTRELVGVMAEEPAVCRQLHLPVQSGHNRTLKRMLRRYTVEQYLEKIDWVREAIPEIALSTDVIVGFPGETDEEYEATLDLMRTVRFDDAFLYKYSPRDGTPATRLPAGQFIPDEVAQARLERLIELHREIQAEINESEVGRSVQVLVEKEAKRGGLQARTEGNKIVVFQGPGRLIGRLVDVRLISTTGATFAGELIDEGLPRVA